MVLFVPLESRVWDVFRHGCLLVQVHVKVIDPNIELELQKQQDVQTADLWVDGIN